MSTEVDRVEGGGISDGKNDHEAFLVVSCPSEGVPHVHTAEDVLLTVQGRRMHVRNVLFLLPPIYLGRH